MTQDEDAVKATTTTAGNGDAERYPQSRPRRHWGVICLLVVMAVGVVMVPVLLANGGRNLHLVADRLGIPLEGLRPVEAPVLERQGRVDVPALAAEPLPPPSPVRSLAPEPITADQPPRLEPPAASWRPEQGCNGVEPGVTGEKPVFLQAEDGRWECTVLIVLGTGSKPASLFLQVRGAAVAVANLRMKLNFGAPEDNAALVEKAKVLAGLVLAPVDVDSLAYIGDRMQAEQPFRTETGNYRMTFRAEVNDSARFNFIAYSKTATPLPTTEENFDPAENPRVGR